MSSPRLLQRLNSFSQSTRSLAFTLDNSVNSVNLDNSNRGLNQRSPSNGLNRSSSNPRRGSNVEPGDTLKRARHLGDLNGRYKTREFVGNGDRRDTYRFNLSETKDFQLSLWGLRADADVELLNQQGQVIAASGNGGRTAESLRCTLEAGVYQVRVSSYRSHATHYNLSLNTSAIAPTEWTVMVYMAGHNLETAALQDFLEMAQVGSNEHVNIVVQMDRTAARNPAMMFNPYSDNVYFENWTDTRRGLVGRSDLPCQDWGVSIGEVNMGKTSTLSNFVSWGTKNFQSDHYALLLWGHGDGTSVAIDDISGNGINAGELNNALSAASGQIDLVGADACLMGMSEFAYTIRNQAEVFVGSQEIVPGDGYDYRAILSDLSANPGMSASQLGSTLVNRYAEFYNNSGANNSFLETLSAIDLTALKDDTPNGFTAAVNSFAITVMNTATEFEVSTLYGFQYEYAYTFGDGDYRYCDIGNLFSSIANSNDLSEGIRNAAQGVLNGYRNLVINNFSVEAGRATGLSIYFSDPYADPATFYSEIETSFAADTQWDEMLFWL